MIISPGERTAVVIENPFNFLATGETGKSFAGSPCPDEQRRALFSISLTGDNEISFIKPGIIYVGALTKLAEPTVYREVRRMAVHRNKINARTSEGMRKKRN